MIRSEWKRLMKEHEPVGDLVNVMKEREDFKETVLAEHTSDIVNEPSHYKRWPIEPIEFTMRNNFEGWRSNCTKYICRAGFKLYEGKTKEESEIIDLRKNIRYSEMRINQLLGKDKL